MANLLNQYREKINRESPESQVYKHFGRPSMDDFLRRCEQLKNQLQLSQQEIEEAIHSACDFYMGVRSVLEQLTIGGVLEGTSRMRGCQTHPDGDLRKDAIQFGINTVLQFINNGTPCVLENFHKAILAYLSALEMDLSDRAAKHKV